MVEVVLVVGHLVFLETTNRFSYFSRKSIMLDSAPRDKPTNFACFIFAFLLILYGCCVAPA
jgi:hypothetical protein